MDAQETEGKTEEKAKESTDEKGTVDKEEGDKPESTSILDRVIKENERMEANIKSQEEIITRQEEIAARKILGGGSEAGSENKEPEKTPQEAAKEYIDKNFANLK